VEIALFSKEFGVSHIGTGPFQEALEIGSPHGDVAVL
jgi:hypothetical protein